MRARHIVWLLWAVGVAGRAVLAGEGLATVGAEEGRPPSAAAVGGSAGGPAQGEAGAPEEECGCGVEGLDLSLGLTQVYQDAARGEVTHRHAGRWTGSYDLEIEADLDRLAGLAGWRVYVLTEGSWSEGLDASSVGSLLGINDDAGGDRSADVTEFWFQRDFLDGRLRLRLGKLDLTGGFECRGCPVAFDGNAYAGDETSQFLASPLVNNPTIPFPENGIGLVVYAEPVEGWFASAGVADAQADARETGFNTAFRREDYAFAIAEVGYAGGLPGPGDGRLPGACRVGLWYDPQPKDRLDGTGSRRDDLGFYVSADQMLLAEAGDPEQGLGLFARFGWADEDLNPIRTFWSVGCQYRGPIPGRDADVLGVGLARARLSEAVGTGFSAAYETLLEVYYAAEVAPWLVVSPLVQVVTNPGGSASADDAVVVGVRVQASF